MSVPTSNSRSCPPERVWDELAAGLTSGSEADELLTHAATCAACAETLRDAIAVFAVDEVHPDVTELPRRHSGRDRSRYRLLAAAAVVLLCLGGALWWTLRGPRDTLTLLAEAYAKDRGIELRIPGAPHGAVRIERSGSARALSAQSPELLELAARIARQLREQPMDPRALHARGRLALIEWKPDVAIEALQAARDLGASQPGVTIDLATAYFQRGEIRGTDGAADFTLALDLLGPVIQQDSNNTVARFNRALVAERLHLLAPAVADLEEVVRSEQSGAWRKEAEDRLMRLRQALQGFFDRPAEADQRRFAEVALDRELAEGLTDQAAKTAARLQLENGDIWLAELIAHRNPNDRELYRQLSTLASIRGTSARGRYSAEPELLRGWATAPLPPPLNAWRDYEAAYRATHSGGRFPCTPTTRSVDYRRRRYYWIAANLEREAAICASLGGSIGSALAHSRQAVAIAREAKLPVTMVRNEAIDATFDYRQGRYREALTRFTALLGRIVSEGLPLVRSHEPLHNMVVSTSALGRYHASHLAATMATFVADASRLRSAQFADRINGADAALRAGNRAAAADLYREALHLHDKAPSLAATPDARAWAEMILADLTGRSVLPQQLAASKDPFVRLPYARLRARQEATAGQVEAALRRLDDSLRWLVELRGPRNNQVWRQEFRSTADDVLRMAIRQRGPRESFARLQQVYEADEASLRTGPFRRSLWRPDVVFSLRALGQDVHVWRSEGSSVALHTHAAVLPRIEGASRRLRMLVSSPGSPPAAILTESQALTAALFGSWLSEIGPAKKILFQCEGILAEIPYPLLMTAQGAIGLNHEWALTRSAILDRPARSAESSAAAADRLFVDASHVASLASWHLQPLPFPREEQQALRRLGGRLAELQGKGASAAGLHEALGSTSLLHFAGHAVSRNGTIGLLLDDGFLEMEGVSAPGTVVLSACSTGRAHQQEVDTLSAGTLAHAFVLAGAADVLASSWNLDSTAAAEFASVLYARLGAGEDFGMASLEAARHLAHVAAFAHPYYWAGQMRLIRT